MKVFAALSFAAMAAARAPVLRGHNVGDADVIADSYIVVFKQGAKADFGAGLMSLKKAGIQAEFEYNIGEQFLGFSATLSQEQLDFVTHMPGVDFVEVDSRVYALQGTPSCSSTQTGLPGGLWGLAASDGRSDNNYNYAASGGDNVDVYIIDTGMNCGHNEYGSRNCENTFCANAAWCSPGDLNTDGNGHGTHVAGTATSPTYGIAKGNTNIKGVKVLSDLGFGSNAGVIGGVDHSAEDNAGGNGVANMSLGGGANAALDNAMAAAKASGLTTAVASGNGGGANGACNGSPARSPAVVTTGATASGNSLASFTDQGSCVDMLAPGQGVLSTTGTGSGTSTYSGTSMASPHICGNLVLVAGSNPNGSPDDYQRAIEGAARLDIISGVNNATPNRFITTCS